MRTNSPARRNLLKELVTRVPGFRFLPPALLSGMVLALAPHRTLAHDPPTPADIQQARERGELEQRIEFLKRIGNDKMSEELTEQGQAKLMRAALQASGWSASDLNAFAPPPRWRGLPTSGSPKILVVLVDFSDMRASATPSVDNIKANLFGAGSATAQQFFPLESLNRYYARASEGKLNLQGNIIGWHHLPNARSSYQPATNGLTANQKATAENQAIFNILKQALQANAGHNYAQYDSDNDGYIDSLTIIYTGPRGAWATFWWAYQWNFFIPDANTTFFGGKRVKKFTFESLDTRSNGTDFDPQTMTHEMGHVLGLADYYDYTPDTFPKGGVGGLDMMHANRGNHNAFSRWILDWIDPVVVSSGAPVTRTLNASADVSLTGNKAVAIFPNLTNPFGQFFMVENRYRVGNDAGISNLPTNGLLIWHVDATLTGDGTDFQFNNSDGAHKLLKLEQADGLEEIESGGAANAGDYFIAGKSFTPSSHPNSNTYGGQTTNVSVTNISAADRVMTATIGFGNQATTGVATPTFTPLGGTFTNPVSVTIACDTAGATIRYTTDGSTPSATSTVFSTPISVSATTTIKARAFKAGLTDSPVASATYTFNGAVVLTNAVTKSGLAGGVGTAAYFVIAVPSDQTKLEIKASGGTGDCDMYIRRGSFPTLETYDVRPYLSGNNETATVSNPAAGNWYVMLYGYQAYTGLSLVATYSKTAVKVSKPVFAPLPGTFQDGADVTISCATPGATVRYTLDRTDPTSASPIYSAPISLSETTQIRARAYLSNYTDSDIATGDYTISGNGTITTLTDGVAKAGLSGALGSTKFFKLTVPASQTKLLFSTSGGTGDCDMYIRRGSPPTLSTYDYRPYVSGNAESTSIDDPAAGDWYVMLYGYAAYSGLTLLGDYTRVEGTVAAPVFSPEAGTYAAGVSVSISCPTAGAVIRFTTNGTLPTSSSTAYSTPIVLNANTTIKAQAFLTGFTSSTVATAGYVISANAVTPLTKAVAKTNLSGAAGGTSFFRIRVPDGQNSLVIKTSGGTGDVDLYVRKGDLPTETLYDFRPYLGGNNETVTIADPEATDWFVMLRGYSAYTGVTLVADYSSAAATVATPAITPASGSFASPIAVNITSATAGATIRYTTDGSEPSETSSTYGGPLSLTESAIVKARAYKDGLNPSATATATYTVTGPSIAVLTNGVAKSALTAAQGTQKLFRITVPAGMSKLEIKTTGGTGDSDLYVRLGSLPTLTEYDYRPYVGGNEESVTVNNPLAGDWYVMLNAYAAYSGLSLTATFVQNLATVATPVFSPNGGSYASTVTVAITCTTAGATIRYTTDGSEPTAGSNAYTGPLSIDSTTTVKARGFKTGLADSIVAAATYTITGPAVTPLTSGVPVTGVGGAQGAQKFFRITVPAGQSILEIKTTGGTGDADLYVRRGALPTLADYDFRPYLGGNVETVTVNNPIAGDWFVMVNGYLAFSGVTLNASFAAPVPTAAAPVFSPGGGSFSGSATVTITCATAGATIRYTTDGNDPTSAAAEYVGPLNLSSTTTLKARAFKVDMLDSNVTTATYTITGPSVVNLTPGVAKAGLSGASNGQSYFKIVVPAGLTSLQIAISGGTGDCDLYVKRGGVPTVDIYDYRPYQAGNSETVSVDNPIAGDWFIMLRGYAAYSGVSLVANFTSATAQVAAPVLSPGSGTYSGSVLVTMSSTTAGATIRFTTDGSEPSASSTAYTGPVAIVSTATVRARAFFAGLTDSNITSASYTINGPAVTPLTKGVVTLGLAGAANTQRYFSINVPAGQTTLTLSISGGTGDCDLYVRQGALPTKATYDFRPYLTGNSEIVTVNNPAAGDWYVMLDAYAAYSGVALLADYATNLPPAATPVFTPGTSSFASTLNVNIATATPDATVRYTTDGSDPTASSAVYTGSLTLDATVTLKACAFASGYSQSAIATATYTYTGPPITLLGNGVAKMGLNGAFGATAYYKIAVPAGQSTLRISIANGTGDCDLYVRAGALPTTAVYDYRPYLAGNNEIVTINSPAAGDWYIMLNGYAAYSGVTLLADYSVNVSNVATPAINPLGGTFAGPVQVTITCATAGATVRYTTDGSDPAASAAIYASPITISTSCIVKARGFLTGLNDSSVASASYTINSPAAVSLQNTIPVTGLADALSGQRLFKIDVPTGQQSLNVTLNGGTGDCDLYVRFGAPPTIDTFDGASGNFGNTESVSIATPSAGTWYILLNAYSAYNGVTLLAQHTLTNHTAVAGLGGPAGALGYFKVTVPPGQSYLDISIAGSTGDCDLYVRFGAPPTESVFDYRPYTASSNETVSLNAPVAGDYYIMLRGFTAFSGLTLKADYGDLSGL